MANLKKTMLEKGMQLMTDPRVSKVMQDPRFMKAVMTAMSVPGKVQTFTSDKLEQVVKAMDLATQDEVKDLRRTVRRLEEEVSRLQKDTKPAKKKTDDGH